MITTVSSYCAVRMKLLFFVGYYNVLIILIIPALCYVGDTGGRTMQCQQNAHICIGNFNTFVVRIMIVRFEASSTILYWTWITYR